MIKKIVEYPTPLSLQYSTDVRSFDTELFSLIDDLKDSMKENNLDALSAFQIGSFYNVAIVKDEQGELLELINPRLISHKGTITTEESTAYYPGRTATIKRFDAISIVYQDREGKDQNLQATGELSVTIQRKIDYTFGATFIHKMSDSERDRFESNLDRGSDIGNADYCPTVFQRDKIIKLINIIMVVMSITFIVSLFLGDSALKETLWEYELYGSYGVLILNSIYFFYAQYEGKKYVACSSCQIGNIIGTTFISLIKLSIIMALSYFFIR